VTDAGAPPGPADEVVGLVRDGQAKFASGEVEEARTAFARALKLRPDDAGAKAGLERCERLLSEQKSASAEAVATTPPWPSDGPRSDDFPDSGENPEATIVDPNYLMNLGGERGPDAGASSEFPEPLTVPRAAAIERAGETPRPEPARQDKSGAAGTPPPGEPAYPRYVATMPGNYPEVRPGGRPVVPSPPPSASTPLPGPAPVVAYPQMPPGGPSAYPQYATPTGGYLPAPAPGPMGGFAPPHRWMLITSAVGAGCLGLGILIGWAIFGSSSDEAPAAGTVVPLVARDAGGGAAAQPRDAAPSPAAASAPPAAAGAATARVSAIERPVLAALTAPTAGQVLKLHARAAAEVKPGTVLYTIKGDKKAGTAPATVEAPRAGRFESRAGEGDVVAAGDVLGLVVDPDAWLLIADVTGEAVAPSWRCEVTSGDRASRAACRIESVVRLGGGRSRAAAQVAARQAGWLKGDEKDLELTLAPP
jgi:biotin carboxyl carrier protein